MARLQLGAIISKRPQVSAASTATECGAHSELVRSTAGLSEIYCLFACLTLLLMFSQESNFYKGFNSYAVVILLEQNNEKERKMM